MTRESLKTKKIKAKKVAIALKEKYGNQKTELLYWNDPFKLLIAVSLSAQTTDKAVNKVTPKLWEKYPNIKDLSKANYDDVQKILRPLGFYKVKSKNIINCAKLVLEKFDKNVPDDINKLQELPGVGRKTANIVLNVAFDKVEGIAVDTHVFRITHRLNLSNAKDPDKAEIELLKVFDCKYWKDLNHHLVLYGREICTSKNPKCNECYFTKICKFFKNN